MEGFEAIKKLNEEGKAFLDDLKQFDGKSFFHTGHPWLNRIVLSFFHAAGFGAAHALTREVYVDTVGALQSESEGEGHLDSSRRKNKARVPTFRGESGWKSLEAVVKRTGKESVEWGLTAGTYSGVRYGLEEIRGVHDWKNAAIAGAVAGTTLALTQDQPSCDTIVLTAIRGAAVSTVAAMLNRAL